jgi:hypothetical protein
VCSLVCTRVKNELLIKENEETWWKYCAQEIFPAIYIPPKDGSDLSSRRDAIVAALNLLLFLTLKEKHWEEDRAVVIRNLRVDYLNPLEKLLVARMKQARLPVNVDDHNKMMAKMGDEVAGLEEEGDGGEKREWTQESLEESTKKTLLADELVFSIVTRIREFEP